jgi:hypothetical protein
VPLHPPPRAAVEHLDDPPTVEVGDDRGQLAAAAVVGLVERQPPRRPRLAAGGELITSARSEGTGDLVARRALPARHLGVRRAAAHPLEHAPPEAPRHALARRQLRVRLGERPPTLPAAVAALAPHQMRHAARDRPVAHPHHRTLLDLQRRAAAARAAAGPRDQLDLEVEPVALLDYALHPEPLETDDAANVVLHPLFLLAPRSMTTRSLKGQRMSLPKPSTPFHQQDPPTSTEPSRRLKPWARSGVRLALPLGGAGVSVQRNTCLKLRANLVPGGGLGDPTAAAIAASHGVCSGGSREAQLRVRRGPVQRSGQHDALYVGVPRGVAGWGGR